MQKYNYYILNYFINCFKETNYFINKKLEMLYKLEILKSKKVILHEIIFQNIIITFY